MNGDVSSLDDSMVRRVIKKPFDINAVASALIETARDIADQRAGTAGPPAMVVATDANIVTNKVNLVPAETKEQKPVGAAEEPPPEASGIIPPPEKIE
jgi:hypothetical protein